MVPAGLLRLGCLPSIPSSTLAGGAPDVSHTMVGGRFIVRDGAHVDIDVPRELAAAIGP